MSKRRSPPRDAKGRFRAKTRRNPIWWDIGSNVIASHLYEKGMPRVRKHLAKRGIKHPLI